MKVYLQEFPTWRLDVPNDVEPIVVDAEQAKVALLRLLVGARNVKDFTRLLRAQPLLKSIRRLGVDVSCLE